MEPRAPSRSIRAGAAALLAALVIAGCNYTITNEPAAQPDYDQIQESGATFSKGSEPLSPASGLTTHFRGTHEARVHTDAPTGVDEYARGQLGFSTAPVNDTYFYHAALYFPVGTFTGGDPSQRGEIEILRWNAGNPGSGSGGVRIDSAHEGRLFRGSANISDGFRFREGCWNWLAVKQKGGTTDGAAENEVWLNGRLVEQNTTRNIDDGSQIQNIQVGLVSTNTGQDRPLTFYVDDFMVDDTEFHKEPLSGANACQSRPNVLFIVTDDQRADTAVEEGMPKTMDWFKTGGTRPPEGPDPGFSFVGGTEFSQGFATTPLCCPARASIFTGLYSHNHGVESNFQGANSCDNQPATLQRYLRDAGYRTAIFGKYLNRWTTDFVSCSETPGTAPGEPPYFDEHDISVDEGCSTDSRDKTLSFIDQREADDATPWFLVFAPVQPHEGGPHFGASAWPMACAPYGDVAVPRYEPPREQNRSDKPKWVQNWGLSKYLTNVGDQDCPNPPSPGTCYHYSLDDRQIFDREDPANPGQTLPGLQEQQYRALRTADDWIDAILRKLELSGEADNTLAIFISDNGYMWREHGLGRDADCTPTNPAPPNIKRGCGPSTKGQPYLPSIRVPILMRWPAHPTLNRDFIDPRLVANVDLAPTVMDAAGLTPSAFGQPPMDGRSLFGSFARSRLLTEGRLGDTAFTPIEAVPFWGSTITAANSTSHYQYIQYYTDGDARNGDDTNFKEFYDLAGDPDQLRNVFGGLGAAQASALQTQLASDRICKGIHDGEVPGYPACP